MKVFPDRSEAVISGLKFDGSVDQVTMPKWWMLLGNDYTLWEIQIVVGIKMGEEHPVSVIGRAFVIFVNIYNESCNQPSWNVYEILTPIKLNLCSKKKTKMLNIKGTRDQKYTSLKSTEVKYDIKILKFYT